MNLDESENTNPEAAHEIIRQSAGHREACGRDSKEETRKCISLDTGLARDFARGFYQERDFRLRHPTDKQCASPGSTMKVLSRPVVKPTSRTMFNSVKISILHFLLTS